MIKCRRLRSGLHWILSLLLLFGFRPQVDSFNPRSIRSIALAHSTGLSCLELQARATSSNNEGSFDSVKRIFCISDLHTDNSENMAWLQEKCMTSKETNSPGKDDLLIVAGDISHDMITLQTTLRLLLSLECHVFFVPGNHEAWLSPRSIQKHKTSLDKMDLVAQTCRHMGVHTDSALIGAHHQHPIWLVPLQSWYDGSLTIQNCEDLCHDFGQWPWSDFLRCRWPRDRFPPRPKTDVNARIPQGLNDYFLQCNEEALIPVRMDPTSTSVVTVSHFLPNSACLPDWKDVNSPNFLRDEWLDHGAPHVSAKFAKVAGSSALDEQVRSLLTPSRQRLLHVFGHSHRPKDIEFSGVRYIHNPLGKPRERSMHMVSPEVDFQLLWDTRIGEVQGEQIVRYWEEKGGGKEMLKERMREHHRRRAALSRRSP